MRRGHCDRGRRGVPALLRGVPFGIKDIFDTSDMPTGYGSPIYTGCRPSFQASAASLPQAAGAILIGKTVTTEFANRHPGPTSHPRNPLHTPGGSSSGSAAAVADFMVPLAIGHPDRRLGDPPGRLLRRRRVQAELRPVSAGRHAPEHRKPRHGRHDGALGRGHGAVPRRADGDPVRGAANAGAAAAPRAVPHDALGSRPSRRAGRCSKTPPRRLRAAGAEIVDSELPSACADISETQRRHSAYEAPRVHAPELRRHAALLSGDLIDGKIADGRELSLDDFRTAWRRADEARAAANDWAGGFDAILTLPAPGQAPKGLGSTGSAVFNALWTVLYMPCLTLPAGEGPDGLPVGIQLVGRRHGDARLLDVGAVGRAHIWGHGNDAQPRQTGFPPPMRSRNSPPGR